MSTNAEEERCPLAPVHSRMEAAHQHWHQAQAAYFSPDEFLYAIQSCIQALRSVTWILQANKRQVPDFDAWYSRWQAQARGDHVMRWLVDARNHIEKRGDLETHSAIHATVVASYLDEIPEAEVSAELFDEISALLGRIPPDVLKQQIVEHGALRLERRWVANTLPSHELLDALAYVYGQLSQLLDSAHLQIGQTESSPDDTNTPTSATGPSDGRLPCMVSPNDHAVAMFSLKTGASLSVKHDEIELGLENAAQVKERYGIEPETIASNRPPNNLEEVATFLFSLGRRIISADGYHQTIAFLLVDKQPVAQIPLAPDSRMEKYLLMREIAKEVSRTGADAICMIGEVWTAPAEALSPYQYPVDHPDRKEGLILHAASKHGESFEIYAEITRTETGIQLGENTILKAEANNLFAPIRKVWGLDA